LTCLSKAGQPDYKPADRFINQRPVYEPVRFTIGSQHIHHEWGVHTTLICMDIGLHKMTSVGTILCRGWDISNLKLRSDNPKAGRWIWELSYQKLKAENDSPRTVARGLVGP